MPSSILIGILYYDTFNDDFSCTTWIYFLKNKDEVFSNIIEFKALIEIIHGIISRCFAQIMEVSIHPQSLILFARKKRSKGS
jgi:hypothetical protein